MQRTEEKMGDTSSGLYKGGRDVSAQGDFRTNRPKVPDYRPNILDSASITYADVTQGHVCCRHPAGY
jgi:hypothetical protein